MGINPGGLLEVKEGAAYINRKETWIRKRIERRTIPFRRIGGRIYLVPAELEAWRNSAPGVTAAEAIENANRVVPVRSSITRRRKEVKKS